MRTVKCLLDVILTPGGDVDGIASMQMFDGSIASFKLIEIDDEIKEFDFKEKDLLPGGQYEKLIQEFGEEVINDCCNIIKKCNKMKGFDKLYVNRLQNMCEGY